MRRACVLFALLATAGCGEQLKPETLVERLRVLSMVAEPPEVAPGEGTDFSIVQLDPSRPFGKTTVIWMGCQPDPFSVGRGACNDTSVLLQPTKLSGFPPGVSMLGFGVKAGYTPDRTVFDPVPVDDPIRYTGTVGQVLAVVFGEEITPTTSLDELRAIFERVERREVQTFLGMTRVLVSEKPVRNRNPRLANLEVDGVRLPPNGTLLVWPGQQASLDAKVEDGSAETWQQLTPDGYVDRTEALVAAWYSTGGRFSVPRVTLGEGTVTTFTAPGSDTVADDPVPEKRTGKLWVVLRDDRGGQANRQVPIFVCDASNPAARPTSITLPSAPGEPVEVRGEAMASALDIVVGDAALANAGYSTSRGAFLGDDPGLPSGTYPVRVRSKDCSDVDTGLTYVVP